ncbi:MAG: HAMP domain-containing histidine kinase [Oscillospiraceae bacterium]|jgi:signal transduction histidine kinase|nr:HAMP domain-containing histidine kinase [Oscillospiraceae bacterium]
MEVIYETEKKDLEIKNQQYIISRQNMERGIMTAGIAVCVIILVLLWNMLRLRTRRNRALTETNATKDKFFSIISHDLKNPAVTLLDSLKILVKNGSEWDTNILTEYYNDLLHSAEEHVELIYSLLDWTRVQTGRMTYTPEKLDLSSCLRFDVSQISSLAAKKGITLVDNVPEDVHITGDCNMLATIVRNLLTNAVKFTSSGGTVTLSTEPTNNNRYIIAISDTGIGMTKKQMDNLFLLDSAHSQRGTAGEQGSGLGLIVCKELLEKHNTTLHMESEEGKGSRFWFEI